jgi:hypothetical protein
MNPNSQSLLGVLAGFDADFVAALEQQQADKLTAQELEALCSGCSQQHPRLLILATGEATTIRLPSSMAACPYISYGRGLS